MEFPKFDLRTLTPLAMVKLAAVAILGLFLLMVILKIGGNAISEIGSIGGMNGGFAVMPSMPGAYPQSDYDKMSAGYDGMAELSARNASVMYPPTQGTSGNTAEEYEVTDYNATIETRKLAESCDSIADLKAKEYVIFESSNSYDQGCSFIFKVEHSRVEEILAVIKDLSPRELSENTYTIKNQIDDFTSETEVLEKKRASIDQTLQNAINAYDEITELATRNQDAESLARIIDSKIQLIERLTQERININEQLDRLTRAKADQLDRLEYTYFNVSIYERKYIDGEGLVDSWKNAIRQTIHDINTILQDVTIGLVALLFLILQYVLYFFILLVIAKYGWKYAKKIWLK